MSVIVIGNTEYSQMLMEYIEESGVHVDAFSVDDNFINEKELSHKPVLSFNKLFNEYSPKKTVLYLGIGYTKLGSVKKNIFLRLKNRGYRFANFIHASACLSSNVLIGEGNVFFENVVVQRNAIIGNGNLFFSNATIMHDNRIGDYNTFGACSVSNGFVAINDCNFIGSNATIKDKIIVMSNNLIGAGAYWEKECWR